MMGKRRGIPYHSFLAELAEVVREVMNILRQRKQRILLMLALVLSLIVGSTRLRADTGSCNGASFTLPFTDVPSSNIFFCSIASVYFSGLTAGTSATTYSPSAAVSREQMAAFISRTLDQSLRRGSRRAALNQWWTPQGPSAIPKFPVGNLPVGVACDGTDIWVANQGTGLSGDIGSVSRIRASDGKLLGTWTGTQSAIGVVVARGFIYVIGNTSPGRLYRIDPTQPPGAATLVTSSLGDSPKGIAFDGKRIWTINIDGSVTIVSFEQLCAPNCVTTVDNGFQSFQGMLYDGDNIWVADTGTQHLKKLNSTGGIIQSVSVDSNGHPIFDGMNIWLPHRTDDYISVVRVKDSQGKPLANPFVLATLTGNGLDGPFAIAFDGERILVVNESFGDGNTVSLWKATDLTPLGFFTVSSPSSGVSRACSDGVNFWITLREEGALARF
jgi:hypothetical protein